MPTIRISDREGVETAHEAAEGISVMEIIRNAGHDEVLALRGGNARAQPARSMWASGSA